jgi:hypothetical protein
MRLENPLGAVRPTVDSSPAVVVVSHGQAVEEEVIVDIQWRPQRRARRVVDIQTGVG